MTDFSRGQKGKLADMGCTGAFPVVLTLAAEGMDIDCSCFGLDASEHLSDDRFMVFFNQKSCPGGGVKLDTGQATSTFSIDVSLLPDSIQKLVFTAAINGEGTLRQLGASSLQLGSTTFPFSGTDFQNEKAVLIGELYPRDGQWRFGAVGQGFNGGLSALLKHFGGIELAPPAAPEPKKVSLSKITLEKRGDKVSLEKSVSGGFGRTRVNLNWNQGPVASAEPKRSGMFGRLRSSLPATPAPGIDLDLGCMFEMADGSSGCIQALGKSWGSFDMAPYIQLDGDDRSGSNSGGENLLINGDQFQSIKRILIYTFIYEGAPDWAATDGVVTIEVPERVPVEVRLDNGIDSSLCVIAQIENCSGNLQITKMVEYFKNVTNKSAHQQINDRFAFGLRFTTGSKD